MKNLFRALDYPDLNWHEIGPRDHRRAAFNLIDLVGFATRERGNYNEKTRTDGPPYKIYAPSGWAGEKPDKDKAYATVPAAKRAGRKWVMKWLEKATPGPLIWTALDTGCHFVGTAPDGPEVARYYFCEKATEHWHVGFRVWFGGTFYTLDFANPTEARAAAEETWREWLEKAHQKFFPKPPEGGTGA